MNREISDHEYLLGRVVASFQGLELSLIEYFSSLISWTDRDLGYIISDGLSFKKLVGAVDALAKHRREESYDQLSEILGNCLKLEEERNRYVHAYWDIASTDDDRVTWSWFKRRNRLGKGNVLSQELLGSDLDSFVQRASDLEDAVRKRIRKPHTA